MKNTRFFALLTATTIAFSFSGCVTRGKLKPEKLAALQPMNITGPANLEMGTIYDDTTSKAIAIAGAQFGLVGGIVFGGVAAANTAAGVKRFSSATAGNDDAVRAEVLSAVKRTLSGRALLAVENTPPVSSLAIKQMSLGVAHAGNQRFTAVVTVSAEILKAKGGTAWRNFATASSTTTFTLDEVKANPTLYRAAVLDAARLAGEKLGSAF